MKIFRLIPFLLLSFAALGQSSVTIVTNVAQLLAIAPIPTRPVVDVLGQATANDGLGRTVIYSASSAAATNTWAAGGPIARPYGAATGRYFRLLDLDIENKLPLAGGTLTGALAMSGNKITGLGTPSATNDAATKAYADGLVAGTYLPLAGGTMSGAIAMGSNKITGLGTPTTGTDAATKTYADLMLPLTGGALTGNETFSGTGFYGLRLNNLTTTQRDATTAAAGAIIWNTTTSRVNRYDGSAWSDGWVQLSGDTMTGGLTVTGLITGTTNLVLNTDGAQIKWGASADLLLGRAAANVLEMRNSTSAQEFRQYNTYTDASNYERGYVKWASNTYRVGTEAAGSGTARNVNIVVGGTVVHSITSTGETITGTLDVTSSLSSQNRLQITSASMWKSATDGVFTALNAAQTGFTALNYGGTTSSFPAHRVNGTGIDLKLADNSAYTAFQHLYERFGSGSPEGSVAAPVGAIYHRTDGGTGTSQYFKETGTTGNTGWVAK